MDKRINTIIVEDEEHASSVLELLLKKHCPPNSGKKLFVNPLSKSIQEIDQIKTRPCIS